VRRRKKRKKLKRKRSGDISTGQVLAVIAGVMLFIWLGVAALLYFVPGSSFLIWMLARIACALSALAVRYMARQEGVGIWLMVVFIPLYDIYFAIRYPKEAGAAVVMQYYSLLI